MAGEVSELESDVISGETTQSAVSAGSYRHGTLHTYIMRDAVEGPLFQTTRDLRQMS